MCVSTLYLIWAVYPIFLLDSLWTLFSGWWALYSVWKWDGLSNLLWVALWMGWDSMLGRGRTLSLLSSAYTGCTIMLPWAHLKPLSGGDDQRQPIFVRGGNSLLINMCCPFRSHFQYSVQQQDLYVWRTRLTRHKCLLHMLCLHSHSIKYDCIFPHALLKQLLWHAKSALHDSHMQTTDLPVVIIIETQKLKTERHHYGILFFSNGKELFFNVRLLFFFLFPPSFLGRNLLWHCEVSKNSCMNIPQCSTPPVHEKWPPLSCGISCHYLTCPQPSLLIFPFLPL